MINTKPDILDLIKQYQNGNKQVLEIIIEQNKNLAYSLISRYKVSKIEEREDLNQVAIIGLIKAIDNFNFDYDVSFSTYAVPIILGEIKKYFRESSLFKVSRNIKDLYYKIEKEKKDAEKTSNAANNEKEQKLAKDKVNANREKAPLNNRVRLYISLKVVCFYFLTVM